MKPIDVAGIKLNHIRIFLSVVEYGSFTLAAEKLHMTQPFVSKSIANLEQDLGLYLFVRGNRTFHTTPAGKRLYQDWKMMMQNFENSLITAHAIQTGLTDKLQVGVGQLNQEENIVIENLKRTKQMMPGLEIVVEYNDMASLLDSLVLGGTDLIVISKHMLPNVKKLELEWKTLVKTCLSVFVHKDNKLYEREQLSFADLKDEAFIVFSYEYDEGYMRLLYQLAQDAGFIPRISCYVPNEMSFKANLQLGNGVVLADSFCALESAEIRRFDLGIPNDIIAVWKPKNERESIQTFLNCF